MKNKDVVKQYKDACEILAKALRKPIKAQICL
jgi:methionine aminopeptidase